MAKTETTTPTTPDTFMTAVATSAATQANMATLQKLMLKREEIQNAADALDVEIDAIRAILTDGFANTLVDLNLALGMTTVIPRFGTTKPAKAWWQK